MNIGPLDDLPVHQTPEPLGAPLPHRDQGERYFFAGYAPAARTVFAATFGLWPGRGVADAAVSIARDGVQSTTAASGSLDPDRPLRVGAIRLDVIAPLQRFTLAADDSPGLTAALQFTAVTEPDAERLHPALTGGHEDVTRFTQAGAWTGRIVVEGEAIEIDAPGFRRRVWGRQLIGERPEFGRPLDELPHLVQLDTEVIHSGRAALRHEILDEEGGTRYAYGTLQRSDLSLTPGTRWPDEIRLIDRDAHLLEGRLTERLLLSELGSLDPDWPEGGYKGDDARRIRRRRHSEVDTDDLAAVHTLSAGPLRIDGRAGGVALLDACILGAYRPLGLEGWTGS